MARRPDAYSATPVARKPAPAPSNAETSRLAGEALANASADSTTAVDTRPRATPSTDPTAASTRVRSACMRSRCRRLAPRIRRIACSRRSALASTPPAYAVRIAASSAPGSPRKTNMRLAVRASSRATWSALEMLSIKTSCPGAMSLTASATACVWARAVPGSASSGSRTMKTSTSRIGWLRRMVPGAVATFWKAGTIVLAKTSGPTITVFRT